MLFKTANLSQLNEFDEIIDVRTPAEFAEDHIPGALNYPVLSNEERIIIGTLYKQSSPFEARKAGAVFVARNIAGYLQTRLSDYPKTWRPLIYCWRGGQRSGAMSIILSQIGWSAHKLEGGYKYYRRNVLSKLEELPQNLQFRVICGPTGSGKSRLLKVLAQQGHQVLDLENLAQHRGSVLGRIPAQAQPSQKWFDSVLLVKLQTFDATKPIFIEAESNKIGRITLPLSLVSAMHNSACIVLETPIAIRIAGLIEDYSHYILNPDLLNLHLQSLIHFHSKEHIAQWIQYIQCRDYQNLVSELLTRHYDPSYLRATAKHYKLLGVAQKISINNITEFALRDITRQLA